MGWWKKALKYGPVTSSHTLFKGAFHAGSKLGKPLARYGTKFGNSLWPMSTVYSSQVGDHDLPVYSARNVDDIVNDWQSGKPN